MIALFAQYGAMVIAAIVALLSVWYAGKTKGEANAKVKAAEQRTIDQEQLKVDEIQKAEAATQAEVKAIGNAHEQVTDVNAMSDADVLNELRRDYSEDRSSNR